MSEPVWFSAKAATHSSSPSSDRWISHGAWDGTHALLMLPLSSTPHRVIFLLCGCLSCSTKPCKTTFPSYSCKMKAYRVRDKILRCETYTDSVTGLLSLDAIPGHRFGEATKISASVRHWLLQVLSAKVPRPPVYRTGLP